MSEPSARSERSEALPGGPDIDAARDGSKASESSERIARRTAVDSTSAADRADRPGAGSLEPDSNLRLMGRVCVRVAIAGAIVYGVWVALAWVIDAQG